MSRHTLFTGGLWHTGPDVLATPIPPSELPSVRTLLPSVEGFVPTPTRNGPSEERPWLRGSVLYTGHTSLRFDGKTGVDPQSHPPPGPFFDGWSRSSVSSLRLHSYSKQSVFSLLFLIPVRSETLTMSLPLFLLDPENMVNFLFQYYRTWPHHRLPLHAPSVFSVNK